MVDPSAHAAGGRVVAVQVNAPVGAPIGVGAVALGDSPAGRPGIQPLLPKTGLDGALKLGGQTPATRSAAAPAEPLASEKAAAQTPIAFNSGMPMAIAAPTKEPDLQADAGQAATLAERGQAISADGRFQAPASRLSAHVRGALASFFPSRKESHEVVFSDFDGTLSAGFISMDFMDYLAGEGLYQQTPHKLYTKEEYAYQMRILEEYKKQKRSYDSWVEEWGRSWGRGLAGQRHEDVMAAAKEFFVAFQKNIFPESKALMARLTQAGYHLVFVSAGVWETAELARRYLGMDGVLATQVEVKDGVYTGRLLTDLHKSTGKGAAIDAYRKEHAFGQPIFAFGDSTGDLPMLERARFPVALNPNKDLQTVAESRGWIQARSREVVAAIDGIITKTAQKTAAGHKALRSSTLAAFKFLASWFGAR